MIKKLMLIGLFSTQALGMESKAVEPVSKRMKDDTALNADLLLAMARHGSARDRLQACVDLIERGANVNTVNPDGNTLLHLAVKSSDSTFRGIIPVLIEAGADVNARNNQGKTPLQITLEKHTEGFFQINDWGSVLKLVTGGANIPPADEEGNTILHRAARYLRDLIPFIEDLIARGVSVHDLNNDQDSPLPLIEVLIARGISVHDLNNDQDSPLHVASAAGNGQIALALIASGADVNSVNVVGDTPLHLAAKNYYSEGIIRFLIDAGADVNARNKQGETPLQIVLKNKKWGNMLELVTRGANIPSADEEGNTCLHLATRYSRDLVLIEALIARGISVHDLNNDQDSPLHVVSAAGNSHIALALIESGVNVHSANVGGDTPLHLAACNGLVEVSRALLDRKANPIELNGQGDTPITLAAKCESNAYQKRSNAYQSRNTYQSGNAKVCLMCIQYATQTTVRDEESRVDLLQGIRRITTDKEVLSCALRGALATNNLDYAQALLVAGAALPDKAFFDAVKAHHIDQCVLLFNHGASPWERVQLNNAVYNRSRLYITPLHMLISQNSLDPFLQGLWKTSPIIKINLGNEIVDLPERFLELFPLIAQRVRERSSDKDLISVPELSPIWRTLKPISYLLFIYSIIGKLQEKGQEIEPKGRIVPERREEVERLLRYLENQLFNKLSHCTVADISTLRGVLKSLGATILDRPMESVLQKMEAPVLQTLLDDRPVIDEEDDMRIQCSDDERVLLVPKAYCKISMTLKNIAEEIEDPENDYIPLPNISSATWKLIDGQKEALYALALIRGNEQISAQAKKDTMTPYLVTLMSAYKDLSLPELQALIQAANYLDIRPLLESTLEIFARHCSVCVVQEALPGTQVTFDNVLMQKVSIKRQYKAKKLLEPFLRQVIGDPRRLMIEKLHPEAKKIALQWIEEEQKKR